jgi:uncharacterized protein YecT (DUF1311 family)
MPRIIIVRSVCLAVLLLCVLAPCHADSNDDTMPESHKDIAVDPCSGDSAKLQPCKDGLLTRLAHAADAAAQAALAKANPVTAVLLKRDQVWFGEIVQLDAQNLDQTSGQEHWDKIVTALKRRTAQLGDVAQGLGRTGAAGRWVNAFGTVELTPAPDGAFRVALASEAVYGPDDEQQLRCKASALVRPGMDGWLAGDADASDDARAGGKPSRVKIRLQGQTLRVIAGDEMHPRERADIVCRGANQLTGSYFPTGKSDASGGAAPFVAPTFDCARLATAAEEEICADSELAANDVHLNHAWNELLPRLDATTRRWLIEDQRGWVKTQAQRYPGQLHPASAKLSYFAHWTAAARDSLAQLQRERIAMLEGFDETRRGFEGDWQSYNARLSVTSIDGALKAYGDKWFEDDYKGGCEYDFNGKAVDGLFKPDDTTKNPDSMERDHATLIVNRTDDAAAKRRFKADGSLNPDADEAKCRRSLSISSTARLFPVRRSPDLGNSGR